MASKVAQIFGPQGKESPEQTRPPGPSWASAWTGGTSASATATQENSARRPRRRAGEDREISRPVLGCTSVPGAAGEGGVCGWSQLCPLLPRWSPTAALGRHFWAVPHGRSCPVFPISPVGFASRRMLTVSASECSHN